MTNLDRRAFLRRAGGAILAPSLVGLAACSVGPRTAGRSSASAGVVHATLGTGGYGPLNDSRDAAGIRVPRGFRVARVSTTGQPSLADDSFVVPPALDGMAAFPGPDGTVRLVRNHEIRDSLEVARPFGSENVYDPRAGGGTTTLELRILGDRSERRIEVLREFPSLNGTHVNCAGGPTPWGSWLSCEESTAERDRKHGYAFEVPALANGAVDPIPLREMGRFVHEAAAVDPRTGYVYETEDIRYRPEDGLPGSGFYRFLPHSPGDLRAGGRLQMLAVRDRPNYLTSVGQTPGTRLPVEWVGIDDPDPEEATSDPSAVFRQGAANGGAVFHRLEGCWYGDGSVFFDATEGGDAGAGQIWQFRPGTVDREGSGADIGELLLVFESPGAGVLESPDNICVSPRGGIVLCEDGSGAQFVRGLTPDGAIFDLVETNGPSPEFAGACFSPDGEVLFFNIQGSTTTAGSRVGYTFAMWGPWEDGAL